LNVTSQIISDRGSGIFDTTFISNNISSDTPGEDEILLNQARTLFELKNYADAIINFKGLIDNYKKSEFRYTSLYEMYDCYSGLDTSADQNITDILFGDLKQYLQNKISSNEYDYEFNSIAYDIILMCETRMQNYEVALTGYEFISLYHPDAEQRMLASWDYEEIEDLVNGGGGGEKQITNYSKGTIELQIEEQYEKEVTEIKRFNKIIADDPLMRKIKEDYDKINLSKDNIDLSDRNKKQSLIEDEKLKTRAKDNIFKTKF